MRKGVMMARQDLRYRDPDWLQEKYWGEGLNQREIGSLCGVSQRTILDWMHRLGVCRRTRSEAAFAQFNPSTPEGRAARLEVSERFSAAWKNGAYGSPEEVRRKKSEANVARLDPATPRGREIRRKMSKRARAQYDPSTPEGREARRKDSETHKALFDPSTHEGREARKRLSEAQIALCDPATPEGKERRQKRRKRARADWKSGVHDHKRPRPPFYIYDSIKMRSTWEVRLAAAFDRLGWAWEYEPCRMPYALGDGMHTYAPDFYVPCLDAYFDPHADWYGDAAKFAAVREQNDVALIVLGEDELEWWENYAESGNGTEQKRS